MCARRRSDAVKATDIERSDEVGPHLRRDDEQAIGLVVVGGDLREELVIGDPRGRREMRLRRDFLANLLRNLRRRTCARQIFRHVEIGFVERQGFDEAGVLRKNRADVLRNLSVNVEPRSYENELGTMPLRGHGRHGRAHAKGARFIACRRHHAPLSRAADGDGPAAQGGIVALLDGGEKGVHVDMNDLARQRGVRRRVDGPVIVDIARHAAAIYRKAAICQNKTPRRFDRGGAS